MPRLPQPGSDKGNWGEILNDYLEQSLDGTGKLKSQTVGADQLTTGLISPVGLSGAYADLTGKPTIPEGLTDQNLTALDANAASAFRVQQDARQAAAIAPKLDVATAASLYTELSALARTRTYYPGNKFAFLGDSITWGYPGGKNAWCDYAALFSNGRIQRMRNAGTSADHTSDMLARLDQDVIAQGVNACTVLGGINDILSNESAATTRANLMAIYATLDAAGIRPVLMCVLANTNASPAQRDAIVSLNAWIRQYGLTHHYDVIDLYDLSRDPATGGMWVSWTADGTHPGLAYHVIGRAVSDFLVPRLPTPSLALATASTERRNLIDNALMLVDTNTDGIPDNFSGSNGSGYTHAVLTPAVGTDVIGNWATVTMAVGGVSRRLEWTSFGRLSLGLAFANPGDRIAWASRLSFAPGADAAGASIFAQVEGANVSAAASAVSYAVDGTAYGEFIIPVGFTGRMGIILSTGNGSGVYRIAQPVILNLTRLNGPVLTSTPVVVVPGDGLSGTAVNGVVASDTFARTVGDIVGTMPTVGRNAWTGQTGRIAANGSRAYSLGGAGNAVILDVGATGDTIVSDITRISTQEASTKTTRLYPKYVDASNHLFINMASSSTAGISVRVTVSGVQRTLNTFGAVVIPANTAPADYACQISVIGTAVSTTINGTTLTSTLTPTEAAAIAPSSKIVLTSDSVNHEWDDLSVSVNGTYV